ncbi:MAG: putative dsRNA-binding protein, partial [Anaeromyxobacteraceae bacterium]
RVVAEHGPDHSKVFDVELELRGEVVGRGAGRSKKDAEQAAAKAALDTFQARNGAAAVETPAAAPPPEPEPEPEPIVAVAEPTVRPENPIAELPPAVRPERSEAESKGPKRKRAPAKRATRAKHAPLRAARKPAARKAAVAAPKRARKPAKK